MTLARLWHRTGMRLGIVARIDLGKSEQIWNFGRGLAEATKEPHAIWSLNWLTN